jgi:hypothetical protein
VVTVIDPSGSLPHSVFAPSAAASPMATGFSPNSLSRLAEPDRTKINFTQSWETGAIGAWTAWVRPIIGWYSVALWLGIVRLPVVRRTGQPSR